ncbi:MAG: hypothetical protein WAM89_08745 [Terriglobales bacterium]
MIRSGLRDHVTNGRFTAIDLGVYMYLHMIAKWGTGIAYTNAVAIGNVLDTPTTTINGSLARLRERGYIQYPKGDGKRGSYFIYIMKYRPTVGMLKGWELSDFNAVDLSEVIYSNPNGQRVLTMWKPCAGRAEHVLMTCAGRVLTVRIQEEQAGEKIAQAGTKINKTGKRAGRVSELVSEAGAKLRKPDPNEVPPMSDDLREFLGGGDLCGCGQPVYEGWSTCPDCAHPKCKKCGVDINAYDYDDLCPQCMGKEVCAHGKPLGRGGRCACPIFKME